MPSAMQLEEFGLEVEHEHHALILPSGDPVAPSPSHDHDHHDSSDRHHHTFDPHLLPTPSREQRSLLRSSNLAPSPPLRVVRCLRSGGTPLRLSLAILSLLAVAVLVHLALEKGETSDVESNLPEVVETTTSMSSSSTSYCEDDDDGIDEALGRKVPRGCAAYLGRRPKRGACDDDDDDPPNEIIDESSEKGEEEKEGGTKTKTTTTIRESLRRYCRKSCGLCGTANKEAEDDVDVDVDVVATGATEEEGYGPAEKGTKKKVDAASEVIDAVTEDEGGRVKMDHTSNEVINRAGEDAVPPPSGDGDVIIAVKAEDVSKDSLKGHGGDGSEKKVIVSSTVGGGKGEKPTDGTSTKGGSGSDPSMMPDDGGSERGGDEKTAARPSSPEKANPSPRRDDPPVEEGEGGSSSP